MDESLENEVLGATLTLGTVYVLVAVVGKLLFNLPVEHTLPSLFGLGILYKLSLLIEYLKRR